MKKTDPQHLLGAHIPWYQTRWFWGVLIATQIVLSFFLFYTLSIDTVFTGLLSTLSASTGGWVFSSFAWIFNDLIYPLTIFHIVTVGFLGFKTFKNKIVKAIYPLSYLLLAILSTFIAFQTFSGMV